MPTVRKSVIVPHACETMFELVDRVEDYPRFLPWCAQTRVLERTAVLTHAQIAITYHGVGTRIVTRNAKEAPHGMALELVDGPFAQFAGAWRFTPLGEAGCRVELALEYEFSSSALAGLLGPVFGHVTSTLVDRFVARAESLGTGRSR